MRAASDLAKLYHSVERRLRKIELLYHSLPSRLSGDIGIVIAAAVIDLDNTVLCGLREFTVSSLARTRTLSGHRVSTDRRFMTTEEISAFMLSVVNIARYENLNSPPHVHRKDEPTIRNPKDTEKILIGCAASNTASLQNALAFNFSLFRDIATVRNFYAHRNADTARKVRAQARSMGVLTAHHADDLVQAAVAGRPVSVFEDWLREAQLFFEELMK